VIQRWTSEPLAVPRDPDAPFVSADLEFEDTQHDGPSYVVHLYLNQPDVPEAAVNDPEDGHAGHFTVFGHGECWGDVGHCDVPTSALHAFDRRPPHPLSPVNITVEITDALKALGDVEEVTVTALAVSLDPDKQPEPLRFGRLTLVTYE
jgi:hypothetical protein